MADPPAAGSTPVPVTTPVGVGAPRGPRPLTRRESVGLGGGALVALLIAFGVLARMYYLDKVEGQYLILDVADPEALAGAEATRLMWDAMFFGFLTFAAVGCATVTAAVLWPRQVAHGLAAVFGLLFVVAAIVALAAGRLPVMVPIFLGTIGALMLRLTVASWWRKDRAAWAFLTSLAGVMAILMTFGAPQARAAMGDPRLWYVMVIPALMAAIVVGLYRARDHYLS